MTNNELQKAARYFLVGFLLITSGCAGQQAGAPQTAAASPVVAPAVAPSAQARIAEAKKMGYKLRNQDGEEFFCRTDLKTGSRVARETVCLTAKDIDSLREQTQQNLLNVSRQVMQKPSN